jgi:hypothetical protein
MLADMEVHPLLVVLALAAVEACAPPAEVPTYAALQRGLFQPRCGVGGAACHGDDPQRDLDLLVDPYRALVDVPSVEDPSVLRVKPGDPEQSLLFQALRGPVGAVAQMPPGAALPDDVIEGVRLWIAAGAPEDE